MQTDEQIGQIEDVEDVEDDLGDLGIEGMQDEDQEADGAPGAAAKTEDESPAVAQARQDAKEAQRRLDEEIEADRMKKAVAGVRSSKSETERDAYLDQIAQSDEDRESILEAVRTEVARELLAKNAEDSDALWDAYREADEDQQGALELEANEDQRRMFLSRREEVLVEAPTPEPLAEGEEPKPINWREMRAELDLTTDIESFDDQKRFVETTMAAVRRGEIQVSSEMRQQIDERYPDTHSRTIEAVEAAAGLLGYAKTQWDAAVPFGIGGIVSTTTFRTKDGWAVREIDGRGAVRVRARDDAPSAEQAGIVSTPTPQSADVDWSKLTLADATRLSPTDWARLDAEAPDVKEALLRASSEALEEAQRRERAGLR
jgi:hypothetical protein